MEVLVANQQLVTELFTEREAIRVMRDALLMLERGDVVMPLRSTVSIPGGDRVLALLPSYVGALGAVGVKAVAAFPENYGTEFDTHQGVVLYFETEHGLLRAIVDATSVTALRTAAVSGVATDLLARPDAGDLALIGAGTQAHTHLHAMGAVRTLRRVRVFSVPASSADEFAERESRLLDMPVEVVGSAAEAADGADLICTVTTASQPVLHDEWVSPGAHINAVGAYTPSTRELDSALVARARVYADRREALLHEAGDFLIPKSEGLIDDDHLIGELGEVLAGKVPARTSPEQVTLFKSLGLSIEDLATACYVYQKAKELGVGTWVEIGGGHFGKG